MQTRVRATARVGSGRGGWKRRVVLPSRLRTSSCLLRSRQKAGSLSPHEVTASPCLASRGVESARAACQLHLYARCTGASARPSSVSGGGNSLCWRSPVRRKRSSYSSSAQLRRAAQRAGFCAKFIVFKRTQVFWWYGKVDVKKEV